MTISVYIKTGGREIALQFRTKEEADMAAHNVRNALQQAGCLNPPRVTIAVESFLRVVETGASRLD